jgi:amino acid transporter/nucleotide-binding universal stress UspA family protein
MAKFQTEVRLSSEMTLMDATLIGVGAMIGAGIFVLTGIAAGVSGPALVLAFALDGVITLFTAMAYAELGSCYHDAGGGYVWVKEALPHWNGFLSGWMSWFAHAVACSVYALGFGAYFGFVLNAMGVSLSTWSFLSPNKVLAVLVAVIFAYVNFRGASETGKVGNIVTSLKIIALVVFIGFGLVFLFRRPHAAAAFTPFMPHGWGGVISAMGLTFIAFEGYEIIAQSSEEIQNPKKNIPRAVFLSLIIVLPIYILVAIVAIGSVPPPHGMTPWQYLGAQKETALVEIARHFFRGGGVMLLAAGLISTMSALNATVYSSSRVAFAMGRDRNFPTFFGKIHTKTYSPHWAILVSFFIISFMAVALPITDVATASDIMFLLIFLQVNLAVIKLRKTRPDLDRGYKVPLFPWLAIAGVACNLGLSLYMLAFSLRAWIVAAAWIGAGLVVYRFYASRREIEHARRVRALARLEKKEYTVLVPLTEEREVINLIGIAAPVAKKHNAEILFLRVIEVEENAPLRTGIPDSSASESVLEKATSLVAARGLRARSLVRVSHRFSQAVIDTAVEEECNLIVLGRKKRQAFYDRLFASTMDHVIQDSPAEVAVLHGDLPDAGLSTILIPFGQDIHSRLAVELAKVFEEYYHCRVRVAVVCDPASPAEQREARLAEIRQILDEVGLNAEIAVETTAAILRAVLRQARGADLLLMGRRTAEFFQLLFGESLTRAVTEAAPCPVLWVREYEERPSLIASLLQPHLEATPERNP